MARWLRLICLLGLALGGAGRPAHGQIMGEGWAYRRPLVFKPEVTDAPGEKIAYAEFYTNGQQKPDGSDLRVTNAERMLVPMRVLQSSPNDDFVRIAFALNRGNSPYFIWWGHTEAEKPANSPGAAVAATPPLEIRHGLLTEVYRPVGGALNTDERLQQAFERATFQGAVFEPLIFQSYNPIGEEWVPLVRYTGQFRVENAGSYDVALAAQDVGAMRIDSKLITFQRQAGRDSKNAKTLDLAAGWHTIEVEYTNDRGVQCTVSVSWRRAGVGNFTPIPAMVFAQAARAEVGALETIGRPVTADFSIDPAAEAFVPPENYISRFSFAATLPESLKPAPPLSWDFGDGQTSSLARAHHYYLTPGTYKVTLTFKLGATNLSTATRIRVKDRLYQRFPNPPDDPVKTVQPVLASYNLEKLTAAQLLRGVQYFEQAKAADEELRWGHAWLASRDMQQDLLVWETACDLARLYETRELYKESADVFRQCTEKPLGADALSKAVAANVRARCDYLDDAAEAYKSAEAWKAKPELKSDGAQHTLVVAMAYAAIAQGDGKLAGQWVKEAGNARPHIFEQEQIDQGVMARNVESAIAGHEFEQAEDLLVEWENSYPQTMLEGFTRLMRVKLLVAQGRPWIGGRAGVAHARALPGSFYAAELLYRAGEAFKAAHQPAEAQVALDLLKQKYPESPYAATATGNK